MKKYSLRIAVQNRGRIAEPSTAYLASLGLKFEPNGRNLVSSCLNSDIDILYLRDDDIPEFVSRGAADFGIVGENVLYEKRVGVKILKKMGFGGCRLVIACLKNSAIKTTDDLAGKRIATSYPSLLSAYLKQREISANIISLKGSVEITPQLGLADAICDLTQTGKTLAANSLRVIATILESEAVLIENLFTKSSKENFLKLTSI